jgi:hypothetical protein
VENAMRQASDGKKEAQAQVAAQNVLAIWTGGEMKFRSPTATR